VFQKDKDALRKCGSHLMIMSPILTFLKAHPSKPHSLRQSVG
jgi:hypothetical protein